MDMPLDQITSEATDRLRFTGTRRKELSASYRNQGLRTLSRALHLAVQWKVISHAPRIHLAAENEREEMITPEREEALLKHAGPTLGDVIIVCQDTGARPEEVFRMCIEDIDWDQQSIFNRHGKTKNSKRHLPISDRMQPMLKARAGDRKEGWIFPSDSKCGHLTTVSKMFARARELAALPKSVVLYSARHTFGTTVLEETQNAAVTMRVMGHGSAKMMMRYQHPEYVEAVRRAINRRNLSVPLKQFGPTFGSTQTEGAQANA
jgi:integrase